MHCFHDLRRAPGTMGSNAYLASQKMKTAKIAAPKIKGTSTGADTHGYVVPPQFNPNRTAMDEEMVSKEPT